VLQTLDPALKLLTTLALGGVLGAAFLWWGQFEPVYVSGAATVIDGDNIKIGEQNIRLAGIQAPEMPVRKGKKCNKLLSRPECIERSSYALHWRVGGEHVRCWIVGQSIVSARDKWNRPLGVCFHGETELNAWMLRACHADLPEDPAHHVWRYYPITAARNCGTEQAPVASLDER
jgi:endonuclease YncB( thermonuclease family)